MSTAPHNLPCPCHVVCETLDEALWLRKYVDDYFAEEDWIDAFEDYKSNHGFLLTFGSNGTIESWEGYCVYYEYDPLIFCSNRIEQEDAKSVGDFADNNLDILLAGCEAPERTTNDGFVSSAGACETERE